MINFSSILLIRGFEKLVSGRCSWIHFVWGLEREMAYWGFRCGTKCTSRSNLSITPFEFIELNKHSFWSQIKTSSETGLWLLCDVSVVTSFWNLFVNHLLARRAPAALLLAPSTGQDWANKRVSGSDGGVGQRRPLRDALLSALIVAMIIICGRNCREAVRAYLQLS